MEGYYFIEENNEDGYPADRYLTNSYDEEFQKCLRLSPNNIAFYFQCTPNEAHYSNILGPYECPSSGDTSIFYLNDDEVEIENDYYINEEDTYEAGGQVFTWDWEDMESYPFLRALIYYAYHAQQMVLRERREDRFLKNKGGIQSVEKRATRFNLNQPAIYNITEVVREDAVPTQTSLKQLGVSAKVSSSGYFSGSYSSGSELEEVSLSALGEERVLIYNSSPVEYSISSDSDNLLLSRRATGSIASFQLGSVQYEIWKAHTRHAAKARARSFRRKITTLLKSLLCISSRTQ